MRRTMMILLPALWTAVACGAPIVEYGFEGGVEGWKGLTFTLAGMEGAPMIAPEELEAVAVANAQHVKVGQGSVGLHYEPEPGELFALIRPELSVPGCQSLRMWVKSTTGSVFLVALAEKDGSNYNWPMMLLPNIWQEIRVNLSDFALDDNGTDENGTLDADQIGSLSIADAAGLLGLMAQRVPFLDVDLAPRSMHIDEVVFDSEAGEGSFRRRAGDLGPEIVIGDFETATLPWAFVGAGRVELVRDKQVAAGGEGCLKVTYDLPAGKMAMLVTSIIKAARTEDMYALRLKVKCSADFSLLIQLEEDDKSKYNNMIELTAGDEWTDLEIALDDFELEGDSADENAQLDPGQIKSAVFINPTAALTNQPLNCELWLDEISLLTQ